MAFLIILDIITMEIKDRRKKQQLEKLLRKHGYIQDARPDHREWTKLTSAFYLKIRLDQNNPDGWNGFQAQISTYMRWGVRKNHLDLLLKFLKKGFA